MIGSTPLSAVLGAGTDNTDHEAVRKFIRAACAAGLSLLLIAPDTKIPFDGRTARQRVAADKVAREQAKEAGRRDYLRAKSPSGLALATNSAETLLKYLKQYIETFGENCAVNFAIEVGGSRLVVVDCDTTAQREAFLAMCNQRADFPPTVVTPGAKRDGQWAHFDGGHFYFTVPDDVELPESPGSMTIGSGDEAFAVLWSRRYVLIPPSTRPEGAYELVGREYPLPAWLRGQIAEVAEIKKTRYERNNDRGEDSLAPDIDAWADTVSWASILEPLGWTPTVRPDTCGCDVWTAPGPHDSPKSATAHDAGCSLGRYTETNAPLHIWTDHPGFPFDAYIAENHTSTLSKLQAVAMAGYGGDMRDAMSDLGLISDPDLAMEVCGLDRRDITAEAGVNITNLSASISDAISAIDQVDDDAFDDLTEPVDDSGVHRPTAPGMPTIAPFSYWRDTPPPEYVIDGMIEHGGLSCVVGPPGVGKSTAVLDMVCHIATGRRWQGRRVLKTRVLYLPGEGHRGAVQRIKAWQEMHGYDDKTINEGLLLGDDLLRVASPVEAWQELTTYIIAQQVGLIVFDTYARASTGIDENSATDVGLAIVRFDEVRKLAHCGLTLVHHTGKATPSVARGSNALHGALDTEILVTPGWKFDNRESPIEMPTVGDRYMGRPFDVWTSKQKNAEQWDHPMHLMLRNCEAFDAPYVANAQGEVEWIDPNLIEYARPLEEAVVETAIRIRRYLDELPEQGATRTEIMAAVNPDPYTLSLKDTTRAWKEKVNRAVDKALTYNLIETLTGRPAGNRYIPGTATAEAAREAYTRSLADVRPLDQND